MAVCIQPYHAFVIQGKKQPDLAGKMKRLIYRWKRTRDGLVLHMAGGFNPG
jgi:hypothetical protein